MPPDPPDPIVRDVAAIFAMGKASTTQIAIDSRPSAVIARCSHP